MKRFLILIIIALIILPSPLISDPLPQYDPYEEGEFPLWSYKLHRAERLFFGSMIITLPLSMLLYSLAVESSIIQRPESEAQSYLVQGAIAATLSLGVSLTDFIIGEIRGK